ncbi:Pick C1-like protein 1 [Seminavis robusta]|uniref:Pick C1-like protein 1 n=1 Tax=Seminavis robusta TaxID=568900 RepID=A0A9N8HND1_9STRA|nr:Pick C1-like protein 1 [Seminavis robusta]|eukprot:Sro977_g227060.1 Pick C1-like protein 1 (1410) ;mRNA; f:25532-30785
MTEQRRTTPGIDPGGKNAKVGLGDDNSSYTSCDSSESSPAPPSSSAAVACLVCTGVHQPNRCPLLKMDEAHQAKFFQSILERTASHPGDSPGIDHAQSWAYPATHSKKSKSQAKEDPSQPKSKSHQKATDMSISKAQSWAYPAKSSAKPAKPTASRSKPPKAPQAKPPKPPLKAAPQKPPKAQAQEEAQLESSATKNPPKEAKASKKTASSAEAGPVSTCQSWAHPVKPPQATPSTAKEQENRNQKPRAKEDSSQTEKGVIVKAQSWAYPVKSKTAVEPQKQLQLDTICIADDEEKPIATPERQNIGHESSSSSESSSFQFISPSSETPGDESSRTGSTRHENVSTSGSHRSIIVRNDSNSTRCSQGKPVKSLHTMFSKEDMAYTLELLKLDIHCDDDSTVTVVDEARGTKSHTSKAANLPPRPPPVFYLWTYFTEELIHANMLKCIVALSKHASRNPYLYICSIIALSFTLAGVGFFTNFRMEFDHEVLFTPMDSLPKVHGDWIYEKAGFEDDSDVNLIIHADGKNIMHIDAMKRTFEALDTLRSTPGYDHLCSTSSHLNLKGKPDCWIWSTTQFWEHNYETFKEQVTTDEQLVEKISQSAFPDGTPVYKEASFGKFESVPAWMIDRKGKNVTYDLLTYVPNFIVSVGLPDTEESELFQEIALDRLKELKTKWELEDKEANPESVKLEFFTVYAYLLEYERALTNDMPLVPLTFYVMLLFTCIVFHRLGMGSGKSPNGIEPSRFSLGMLSTFTIGMSLMTGYGLMFCIGIPFTNLSQMVPFIILGVGLDDTFIITGAYFRKLAEENRLESPVGGEEDRDENEIITARIEETMEEVGLSIALTTTTTTFAFCLGCMSTIPGIQWVCLYASATIFADFIYQITLFVAFLTLDERRMIRARKNQVGRDYLYLGNVFGNMRSAAPDDSKSYDGSIVFDDDSKEDDKSLKKETENDADEPLFTQRIMRWYADQLLRPRVKVAVLVVFSALFAFCVWRTTLLKQAFNVEDYVPEDSYTKTFFSSLSNYSSLKLPLTVYFRNVNQSDPIIQDQMREYIAALSDLPQVRQPPDFCWVRDLHAYMTGEATEDMDEDQARQAAIIARAVTAGNNTFSEQLDILLNIPVIRDVYGGDIVRDEQGNILTSRCYLFVRYIDLKSIQEQTQLLYDQRQITALYQPRLEGEVANRGEFSFFSFDELFYYWELYTVSVDELIFTTISGVVAVNVIGFLLIPHWTATAFIFPIIIMLYFNLLGTLQLFGVFINAVTYVTIVIAIGLLVDFLMHILLRYYEATGTTREEKVKETLETMGASMLMGGFTTWLGVIPLSLSSTKIFYTIFVAFMAMVTWGLLISLVLMPVILSMCGPIVCTIAPREPRSPKLDAGKKATTRALGGKPQSEKSLDDDSSLEDEEVATKA